MAEDSDRQLRSLSWDSLQRSYRKYRLAYIISGVASFLLAALACFSLYYYNPLRPESFSLLTNHPVFKVWKDWISIVADVVVAVSGLVSIAATLISRSRAKELKREITQRRNLMASGDRDDAR